MMIFVWAYLAISAIATLILIAACAMAKRADNYFLHDASSIPSASTASASSHQSLSGDQLSDAAQAAG